MRLGALSTTRKAAQMLCVILISKLVHEGCAKTIHQFLIHSQALRQMLGKLTTHISPEIAVASVLGSHSIFKQEVAIVTMCQYPCAETKTLHRPAVSVGRMAAGGGYPRLVRPPRQSRRSKVLEALGEERKGESADAQTHQVCRRYVASKNATSVFFRANRLISLLFSLLRIVATSLLLVSQLCSRGGCMVAPATGS